jgi:hypothetical protein
MYQIAFYEKSVNWANARRGRGDLESNLGSAAVVRKNQRLRVWHINPAKMSPGPGRSGEFGLNGPDKAIPILPKLIQRHKGIWASGAKPPTRQVSVQP